MCTLIILKMIVWENIYSSINVSHFHVTLTVRYIKYENLAIIVSSETE